MIGNITEQIQQKKKKKNRDRKKLQANMTGITKNWFNDFSIIKQNKRTSDLKLNGKEREIEMFNLGQEAKCMVKKRKGKK